MLVRTDVDAPKHKGITWLILEMDQPGVDVRPLKTIEGDSHFCEVFLNEVRRATSASASVHASCEWPGSSVERTTPRCAVASVGSWPRWRRSGA